MFEDLIDNMDVDDEVNNDVSKEEVIVDKVNDERCINTIVDNILNKYLSFIVIHQLKFFCSTLPSSKMAVSFDELTLIHLEATFL